MQEKFVISALTHIRAQSIREGILGQKEAERLLRLYGVDPNGLHVPRKNNVRHRRGGAGCRALSCERCKMAPDGVSGDGRSVSRLRY